MKRTTIKKKVLLPISPDWSRLDALAEVCALELAKLEREKQRPCFLPEQATGIHVADGAKPERSPETSDDKGFTTDYNNGFELENENQILSSSTEHQAPNLTRAAGMPAELRDRIPQLAGPGAAVSDEKLLIQKELTMSDVVKNQNRLTIPTKQMTEKIFLTDDEVRLLESHQGKNVGSLDNVPVIEPSLERGAASLRQWKMHKDSGKMSVSYVITKTWNEIRQRNGLKEGMTVQVWSFRVNGELWLAVIRLPDENQYGRRSRSEMLRHGLSGLDILADVMIELAEQDPEKQQSFLEKEVIKPAPAKFSGGNREPLPSHSDLVTTTSESLSKLAIEASELTKK